MTNNDMKMQGVTIAPEKKSIPCNEWHDYCSTKRTEFADTTSSANAEAIYRAACMFFILLETTSGENPSAKSTLS